jgi:hypothetical protein
VKKVADDGSCCLEVEANFRKTRQNTALRERAVQFVITGMISTSL